MNRSFRIARVLGIPIEVNLSWVLTLFFVTSMLAIRFYPEVIPVDSRYRNDVTVHWIMAVISGFVFFASILLHELAHSIVARLQGIPVKNITLFIFGGVSQISGEARRPLHEFVMAIVGPLTSLALAGIFFAFWWVSGSSESRPHTVVLEWLFLMNLILAIFNMAPGFPMDGGRVLRSLIWGVSGNMFRATQLATLAGRGLGFGLIGLGTLAFLNVFSFIDPWSGVWFAILGFFLESSARQSWFQARALDVLGRYRAGEIMSEDLVTASSDERLRYLVNRVGKRFMFFVTDQDDRVVGAFTEKEVGETDAESMKTAGDVMIPTESVPVAQISDDGSSMMQRMESDGIWHLPIVSDGRVVGIVSKEMLVRLLAQSLFPRERLPI